jgi:DNA invertase Pin-like site-specific DNA recombinase
MMGKWIAIYCRVSTKDQTTDNQVQELRAWAERAGHTVVKVYQGKGISGRFGREKRWDFNALLKAAIRREFEMVATWSCDRLTAVYFCDPTIPSASLGSS